MWISCSFGHWPQTSFVSIVALSSRYGLCIYHRSVDFDENNEEALHVVAIQLGEFINLIGGQENLPKLLPVLEKLACVDETLIREAVC